MKQLLLILLLSCALYAQRVLPAMGSNGTGAASGSPPTFVQATNCSAAALNCTTTAMTVTSGHTLVFCGTTNGNAAFSITTASTGADTFTAVNTVQHSASGSGQCYWVQSTTSSGSTTWKCNWNGGTVMSCVVYEVSGVTTGLDSLNIAGTNPGTTSWPCGTGGATGHNNVLSICFAGAGASSTSLTGSAGYTIPANGSVLTNAAMGTEYEVITTSGTTVTPGFTGTSRVTTYTLFGLY